MTPYDEGYLDHCRESYERTRNPLWAWHAWEVSRWLELECPEWVLAYLDEAARLLVAWEPRADRAPADGPPGAIGKRLGFQFGLATSRKRWRGHDPYDPQNPVSVGMNICFRMQDEALSANSACENADGVSRSSAWRALQEPAVVSYMAGRIAKEFPGHAAELLSLSTSPANGIRTGPTYGVRDADATRGLFSKLCAEGAFQKGPPPS